MNPALTILALTAVTLAAYRLGHQHATRRRLEDKMQHGIRMYAMGAADAAATFDADYTPADEYAKDFYMDQIQNAREGRQ